MPKRKSGSRKKQDKIKAEEKLRQAMGIGGISVEELPCNLPMTCDQCGYRQKNRAFCYFCQAIQTLPQCAQCGKTKCMGGDCIIKHVGRNTTGTGLIGAICDFCEAWVCHSRKCITTHGCPCPLADVLCVECSRDVYSVGGRFYRCCRCAKWLCEDDQMLHQAQCLTMESESLACISCSRAGRWTCTVCKLLFCDTHMVGVRTVIGRGKKDDYPCKKCGFPLQEASNLSLSSRRHAFGRQQKDDGSDNETYDNNDNNWNDWHNNDESDEESNDSDDSDDDSDGDEESITVGLQSTQISEINKK